MRRYIIRQTCFTQLKKNLARFQDRARQSFNQWSKNLKLRICKCLKMLHFSVAYCLWKAITIYFYSLFQLIVGVTKRNSTFFAKHHLLLRHSQRYHCQHNFSGILSILPEKREPCFLHQGGEFNSKTVSNKISIIFYLGPGYLQCCRYPQLASCVNTKLTALFPVCISIPKRLLNSSERYYKKQ